MASATSSIGGLASGLDTATIISQLMQLEAVPQNRLKTKLTSEQSSRTALQALNTQIAALATQAEKLAKASGWGTLKARSSSTDVAVSVTSGVASGTFSFTVDQTAAAHRLSFASSAASSDTVVNAGTTVKLTINGATKTIDTGDGSLDGLVQALNGAGTGVQAGKLKLDDGSYRLVVTAANTGAANAFTLTNTDGSDLLGGATVTAGRDAAITVGSDTIHSASNTFAGVLPGANVTISAAALGTSVDVTVEADTDSVKASVKSLVDAINEALTQIDKLTANSTASSSSSASKSTAGGVLAGNATVRSLRSALLDAVYPGDGTTLASVGIQTDRYGKLVFDEKAFDTAYAADPADVQARFVSGAVDGFAARVQIASEKASDKYTGSLTSAITGQGQTIERLEASIENWDARLELRRSTITRQYTALETALSQLNSQSNWLTQQISSLNPKSSDS